MEGVIFAQEFIPGRIYIPAEILVQELASLLSNYSSGDRKYLTPAWNSSIMHVVWSTKHRGPLIFPPMQPPLSRFLAERAAAKGCRVVAVNCLRDHVHMLFYMPPTVRLADVMHDIKGASSRRIALEAVAGFSWQEGYGATTLRGSDVGAVKDYVERQREHHSEGGAVDDSLEELDDL